MIKKLSGNIFIYGFTNGLKSLVPFIMLPILTYYLSVKDYGTLSLIEALVLFVSPFVMLNIHSAISVEYFILKDKNIFAQYVTNALILTIFSFILVFVILNVFSGLIANIIKINEIWIKIIAFLAFLKIIPLVILSIFQSQNKAFKYFLFSLVLVILDFGLSYVLIVIYNKGINGRIIGTYGSYFVMSVIGLIILYKFHFVIKKIVLNFSKQILEYGLPLIFHSLGGIILAMSDRFFLSYFINNKEVGLYTVAYQISGIMLLFSMSVNQAWRPMLFKFLKEGYLTKIKKINTILLIVFIIVFLIIYLIIPYLYLFFVNVKFYSSKVFILWLLIGFLFQSLYFIYTNYLFFYKKTKLLGSITILGALLNLILNYLGIRLFGAIGVAYATAITWIFYFFSVYYFSKKLIKRIK